MILTRRISSTLVTFGIAVCVLLLVWPMSVTGAGPQLKGSGTGTITNIEITPLRDAGGNQRQARSITGVVDGALSGTFVEEVTGTIHRNGRVTFGGTLIFTGFVEGCGQDQHTLTLGLSGQGQAGLPVTEAMVRVIKHPSNTLQATGHGIIEQEGMNVTYELEYMCR